MRVAVVGSGPAGFYATEALLSQSGLAVEVDMLDRLPTPYGLVRAGVAPDHPKIKSVIRRYEKTAGHEAYRFFGHVTVGRDISATELADAYHAVIWAYGAGADRQLGIPGEDLPGSHAATEFVAWYNGHPDFVDRSFDLSCERVVVIGNGNVAADLARMLVLTREELEATDTADYAIEALADSGVREVVILGRRGPAQAAFTNPEVRELGELLDADVYVDPAAVELDEATRAFLDSEDADVTKRKNHERFAEFAAREPTGKAKRVEFRFLRSPKAIGGDGRVEWIDVAVNELVSGPDGEIRAQETAASERIECGLVLRSIGYLGTGIDGVPYDPHGGVIPNVAGRVIGEGGEHLPGQYVVGWIKRGPSGVIGTNKKDAQETVELLLEDAAAGALPEPGGDATTLHALLAERGIDHVEFEGWRAIDALEQQRGEPLGRPRMKLTRIDEMLHAAARRDDDG